MLNLAWYLFYGRKLNMTKQEILVTPYGEMMDMISCLAIYEGNANQKIKRSWTYEDAIGLR